MKKHKVERKILVPVKGHRIRKETDPTQFVKPVGERLPLTIYYKRRIRRGEMTVKNVKSAPAKKSD